MLSYSFEKKGNMSLYEYIYCCIKKDIVTGKLQAGERLPSKRRLAEQLSVSVITVENAYAQLLCEGYIYSVEKSGYYVSGIEMVPGGAEHPVYRLPEKKTYTVNMRENAVDAGEFPASQWRHISGRVFQRLGDAIFSPCGFSGCDSLRREIADYLRRNRSMDVSADCIIIGAGTEYLCAMLLRLLGAYKVFGLENPGYKKVAALYKSGGARCFYLDLDAGGVSMDALRQSPVEVLHISPNHHYPTGIVTPASRRYELLAWATEREGRYIIEDDYDSELRFDTKPYGSMWAEDKNGKVIYMNTFSKTISPALRVGYLVLPPALMEDFLQKFAAFSCTVSVPEQLTLAEFIAGGQYDRHIHRVKKFYSERRQRFLAMIREKNERNIFTVREEPAGLHFLLQLQTDRSDAALRSQAESQGIALSFLSDFLFYPNEQFAHTLVVNYGNVNENGFSQVLEFLGKL